MAYGASYKCTLLQTVVSSYLKLAPWIVKTNDELRMTIYEGKSGLNPSHLLHRMVELNSIWAHVLEEIIEFVAYGTGELVLYAATLGRHKPNWPYEGKGSGITQELLFNLSTWVGIIFWAAVLVLTAWLVSK